MADENDTGVPVKDGKVVGRLGRVYGRKADIGDLRDKVFSAPLGVSLPRTIDLSPKCTPIEDQGALGSCTGHAYGALLEFITGNKELSRLFIYWWERYLEGDVNQDGGAMMRTGAKVCATYGSSLETLWPYQINKFKAKPSVAAVTDGLKHKAKTYLSVRGLSAMKNCLAQGYPYAIGISVYDSFESDDVAKTGAVPMPDPSKESLLGGHAICVVGYDDLKQAFKCRNSWGKGWGQAGYFWLPYSFMGNTTLASDGWTLRS